MSRRSDAPLQVRSAGLPCTASQVLRSAVLTARTLFLGLTAGVLLAACGERAQVLDTASGKKADEPPWAASKSAEPGFAAAGWKGGDKTAWTGQIHQRNQAQNDYAR